MEAGAVAVEVVAGVVVEAEATVGEVVMEEVVAEVAGDRPLEPNRI